MVFNLGKYLFVGQMFCMAVLPLLCILYLFNFLYIHLHNNSLYNYFSTFCKNGNILFIR